MNAFINGKELCSKINNVTNENLLNITNIPRKSNFIFFVAKKQK